MFDRPPTSPDNKNSFESQYTHKERFDINGAQVEAVDIKPAKPKDALPILVAPGWGATMESFKPGMQILSEQGRRVISLDQPRKGGTVPDLHSKEVKEWYKKRGQKSPGVSDEELRKAATILGLLDQKKLDKVDVIAHSEGSINVCIAAMLQPEKFKSIVLVSPAGLIGKDSILRLKKGADANNRTTTSSMETMSKFPVTEAETEYLDSTKHITPDYIKANPLRMAKELWAISQARIEDMLRYLHEKGIKIAIIEGVEDPMFPQDRMQENFKSISDKKGLIDGYVSVRGGHMQLQVHPELYMSAAEGLLASLGKKE